jgi:hypothetical protein
VLYIVLYQSICKAPLVGRTVQKCSQCARPQEKKVVLRKKKEEERLPARILEQVEARAVVGNFSSRRAGYGKMKSLAGRITKSIPLSRI